MVDEVIGKLFEWFLANGGPGYITAALLGIIAWKLDGRLLDERRQNDIDLAAANVRVQEQYERRLVEFKELLDVMTNSTQTVAVMHNSLTASSDAINQLAIGFAKLMTEFQAQQGRWDDRRGAMADQLRDIQNRIEALQRQTSGRAA